MATEQSVTRWWWIRHAPVTADGGRIYGQTDVECDCSNAEAFLTLAAWMPRDPVLVTSHLKRTLDTAKRIAASGARLPEPLREPMLAEQHFGAWQGRKRADVFAEHADWHRLWLAPARITPPGGESFVELLDRVTSAIGRLTAAHARRDIVAIAHGGTIRAALCLALGLDPDRALAFTIDNLSLTRIDHIDGGRQGAAWRVTAVNRASCEPAQPWP